MNKKVFVAVASHRGWNHESQNSFNQNVIAAQNWSLHTLSVLYEESLIQRARERLAREFLSSQAEYLFFMDDDIVLFDKDTIDLLIKANKDIIGGVYIMKKPPHVPVFYPFTKEYPDLGGNEPIVVRYASTGCLLISRRCVEKLYKEHEYPFECFNATIKQPWSEREEKIYLSEDWAFCHRANALNFNVWIHPKPVLGHLGKYAFSVNDWLAMRKEK